MTAHADPPPPLPLDDIALAATGAEQAPAPMSLQELAASEAGPPPEGIDHLAEQGAGPAPAPDPMLGTVATVAKDPPGPVGGPGDVDGDDATLAKLQGAPSADPPEPMGLEELDRLTTH